MVIIVLRQAGISWDIRIAQGIQISTLHGWNKFVKVTGCLRILTPLNHINGYFFHPLFLFLGKTAAICNLSNIAVYQLCRVLSGFLLLLVCYRFICHFFEDEKTRILSFLIVSVSGGLPWLNWFDPTLGCKGSCLFSSTFRPDSNTFWSLYLHPLFSLSVLLLLLCLLSYQKFMESQKYRYALYSGFALLLLVQFHPFDVLIPVGVLFLQIVLLAVKHKRINLKWLIGFIIMCLVASPYVFYLKFVLMRDPVFKQWSHVVVFPPRFVEYFFMYGFLIVFSVFAIPELIKTFSVRNAFLLSWLILIPIMVSLPIKPPNIPTRLIEGYHVLLSILTALAISKMLFCINEKPTLRIFLAMVILFFLTLGNTWVLIRDMKIFNQPHIDYYLPREIRQGMNWLKTNTHADDAVLGSYATGILIPALAGNRVFLGHFAQTVNWPEKNEMINRYFRGKISESEREDFLRSWNIQYVFYSPLERQLGIYDPDTSPYLIPVFRNAMVSIYQFSSPQTTNKTSIQKGSPLLMARNSVCRSGTP